MSSSTVASVLTTVRSPGMVPSDTTATGVVGGRPPAIIVVGDVVAVAAPEVFA